MDLLLTMVIVAICLIAAGVIYTVVRGGKTGGNDPVWDPSKDPQGTGTHDGSSL